MLVIFPAIATMAGNITSTMTVLLIDTRDPQAAKREG